MCNVVQRKFAWVYGEIVHEGECGKVGFRIKQPGGHATVVVKKDQLFKLRSESVESITEKMVALSSLESKSPQQACHSYHYDSAGYCDNPGRGY